jgi:hypothetical protein
MGCKSPASNPSAGTAATGISNPPSMRNNRLVRTLIPSAPLALAGASSAHAAIVYTDVPDLTISTVSGHIYWDMGTNGGTGFAASSGSSPLADMNLFFDYNLSYVRDINKPSAGLSSYGYLSTTGGFASNFSYGSMIDGVFFAGMANLTNNPGVTGNWTNDGTPGYLGFTFDYDDGIGVSYRYGWARVSYNADKSLTLYDFAYESNAGTGIAAGAGATPVPEPAAAAALAGLLAGSAAAFKRRRRQTCETPAGV